MYFKLTLIIKFNSQLILSVIELYIKISLNYILFFINYIITNLF